ncbi:MAG: 4-carboxymuconolactone decarboxylase, partial [Synechococcaceae bacterium WB9_2_112]|nr:4-carboxymuconolactone decarboxylase [Synechococcaceae bacterium WB9_2_112]
MNSETYAKGMKVRREMLGDAYVDNAMNNADALTQPFQELAVEYCFGSVWAREQLPRNIRSLVNVGMLVALNKPHELEIHLGMALRNGCTKEQLGEVLLQATVYCGMP